MLTVWKFPLEIDRDVLTVEMPQHARVIAAQMQRDEPCLWAIVDADAPKRDYRIAVVGTGHAIPHGVTERDHLGTIQQGSFVWHLFEIRS